MTTRTIRRTRSIPLHAALAGSLVTAASAAPSDVRFSTFDLANEVVVLTNFGQQTEDLSGWRFCSNNTSVVLRYSNAGGLNGRSLAPGASLSVHLGNDAPADPDHINYSTIGGNLAPIDRTAYAMSIYFPDTNGSVNFNNGNLVADFLQFSFMGFDNSTANIRTDEAVAGGAWASILDWIPITNFTLSIELVDASAVLSDSGDYEVIEPCMADLAEPVGTLNFFDIQAYIALYNVHDPAADFAAPFGLWNFFDVQAFISAFNAGCD